MTRPPTPSLRRDEREKGGAAKGIGARRGIPRNMVVEGGKGWGMLVGLSAGMTLLCYSPAEAAEPPPETPTVHLATATVTVFKRHHISFARHADLSVSTGTIDAWLDYGSDALQKKDDDDVACPIILDRQETVSVFTDPGLLAIDDLNDSNALKQVQPYRRVKLVEEILYCGGPVPLDKVAYGCSTVGGNHIAMVPSPMKITVTHEFGHNQGINYDLTDVEFKNRIMFGDEIVGENNRRSVVETECRTFQK